ncbi:MAG TPA: hypothetical protein VFH15_02435 [Pyrinomonadaceae bacterium]|nr:hypothetical protein [Pyrinomonadaceae bacterium]
MSAQNEVAVFNRTSLTCSLPLSTLVDLLGRKSFENLKTQLEITDNFATLVYSN